MSDEQRKADRETLARLATALALNPDAMPLPTQVAALERQLPAMLAALRFVEQHGETLNLALILSGEPVPKSATRAAQEALAALRKP